MEAPTGYLDRIRADYPDLRMASARLNRDGLVNGVVIVNEELVCRFDREILVLDLAQTHVALPLPRFERREADSVVYRLLPGEPLVQHTLLAQDAATQDRLIGQLATVLRQLQTIPPDEVERQRIGRFPTQRDREAWRRFCTAVK